MKKFFILTLFSGLLLTACGQSGPLYMPTPQPKPTPATNQSPTHQSPTQT